MRRFHRASLGICVFSATALLSACADDDFAADLAEDGSGSDEGDEQSFEWVPARGIEIVEIEANQGTRVAITGEDGQWLGPDQRNMRLVGDRDTLIRVHWKVAEGWQPHEVKARLTLDTGAGEPIVREQTLTITDDSHRSSIDRTFYFGLVADEGEAVPGARVLVELFEPDVAADLSLPEAGPAPASGFEQIGFESDPMEMRLMLVPIHYTGAGHDTLPDLDEQNVDQLLDALYEQNPVQTIIHQVRAPVEYAAPMNNLGSLLPVMAMTKQSDGADANVYYHAFIDIGCPIVGCGSKGVAGIALLAGAAKNASTDRVAATVFYDETGNINSTVGTFVHEVGHNQGLNHVYCPGTDAAGPDPTYPYDNGKIGQWGFGIRNFTLHNPTSSHDYMTYCGNTWGSDWTFMKTYERIRTLTAWNYEGAPASTDALGEPLVVGALYVDGTEEWFSIRGGFDVEALTPGEALEFEVDGEHIEQPAVVRTLSDDQTQWVIAPLPERTTIERVERVAHVRAGEVRRVMPARVIRR